MKVFAPVEEFEQAHAVGGAVVPGLGCVGRSTRGPMVFFQSKRSLMVVAFEIVAAGEAEEGWMHGGELLHEVDAVAVGGVVVGGREEGDEGEPGGAGVLHQEFEVVVGGGCEGAGFESEGVSAARRRRARGWWLRRRWLRFCR